jgi:hypothetical protein
MFMGCCAKAEKDALTRRSTSVRIIFELRFMESLPSTKKKDLTQRAKRSERREHREELRGMVVLLGLGSLVIAD